MVHCACAYAPYFLHFADNLAYELGLIDNSRPFAEVKQQARVNDVALRYKDDLRFSQHIRGERVR